ncbi:hypothetical protein PsYK624_096830 [Phanerochaete sordida]|uniref:Uncharacterized protein n=1 Tax=Phanerochaete sordida TaxID=48140 RepID=A0A9P3GFT7_9APHY|nr:hypothetical protein PsYK624_096830 [Phanerochaete sordida]
MGMTRERTSRQPRLQPSASAGSVCLVARCSRARRAAISCQRVGAPLRLPRPQRCAHPGASAAWKFVAAARSLALHMRTGTPAVMRCGFALNFTSGSQPGRRLAAVATSPLATRETAAAKYGRGRAARVGGPARTGARVPRPARVAPYVDPPAGLRPGAGQASPAGVDRRATRGHSKSPARPRTAARALCPCSVIATPARPPQTRRATSVAGTLCACAAARPCARRPCGGAPKKARRLHSRSGSAPTPADAFPHTRFRGTNGGASRQNVRVLFPLICYLLAAALCRHHDTRDGPRTRVKDVRGRAIGETACGPMGTTATS